MAFPNSQTAQPKTIGYVVGGSLKENLRVRLTVPPQQVQEGAFVTIDSAGFRFYGLVTDLQLGATDPRFADEQSEMRLPAELAGLLHGQTLFTTLRGSGINLRPVARLAGAMGLGEPALPYVRPEVRLTAEGESMSRQAEACGRRKGG